ncbi:MAG: DUF3471 domain-containing protein [Acidobacteriota bacterium]
MTKKIILVLIAVYFSQWILLSQTVEQKSKTVFTLGFSTYLSHTDKYAAGFDIYTDSEGYTYISGNTRDKNFPATKGAYQTELKGSADVFVAKYTPEGEIVFATLIGGTKREHHSAITVDELGFIYVAGGTESTDFPVTEGGYDTSFNGTGRWAGDVFVTKLNPTGTDIVFSTFIGGEVEETVGAGGIKVDSKGNIIVVGTTKSIDFPLTKGSIENKDNMHGFITKFSPGGEKLLFSTSFGSSPLEGVTEVDVDDKDNIYLSGSTYTADLPVTDNAFRKEIIMPKTGGVVDHYIAKISGIDNKILYFSYFGTDGYAGSPIKWTKPNKLIVSGSTKAESFPATDNAISKTVKGKQDCYISVFNSETMTLEYATLFGGSEQERVMSAHFLNKDIVVIGGTTSSADFPVTDNALYSEFPVCEKSFNSTFLGRKKSFVSVIDIKNNKLLNSTYFGASFIFRFHPDKNGNISFVAEAGQRGEAGITGFPITKNAVEPPTYTMVGRMLLNAKPKPKKEDLYKDVIVKDAILETYVGKYAVSPGFFLTITRNGSQLKVQATGRKAGPIFPKSRNDFYIKNSEVELTFNINEAGEVVSLTVHPDGGDDVICKKVVD